MGEYVKTKDEATLVQNLLREKGSDYNLGELVASKNIRLRLPHNINEFPAIAVTKTGGREEGYIGDLGESGPENIQHTVLHVSILTRKRIVKTYNNVKYKNEDLVKMIRDVVKQIMFKNHDYDDTDYPDYNWLINMMSGDLEGRGIINVDPIYLITLVYDLTFQMKR